MQWMATVTIAMVQALQLQTANLQTHRSSFFFYTVEPVYNQHLYKAIDNLLFI